MKPTILNLSISFIATGLLLTGCKNEGQNKRIKELVEESAARSSEIETLENRIKETERELNKVRDSLDQAEREKSDAIDELTRTQRQLEVAKKAEETMRQNTRRKPTANPIKEAKKAIEEKISSLWTVQGDQTTCHGVVAESDGKTWLYMPANGLGGSTKVTVKDAEGKTITKFGEFQVAADAALARLEIKLEIPIRYVIGPASITGESPSLILAIPAEGASAPKLEECRAGSITAAAIEFSAYGSSASGGCPIFNGETGALIGIVVPEIVAAAGIWDNPPQDNTESRHAARINRAIDWKAATIGSVLAERRKIDELNRLSRLMEAAASLSPGASGLNPDVEVAGSGRSAKQILEENKDLPGVKDLLKINDDLAGQRLRVSERDIKRRVGSILGQFESASQRAATEARAMHSSPANVAEMKSALKWHDEARKKLAATLAGVGR